MMLKSITIILVLFCFGNGALEGLRKKRLDHISQNNVKYLSLAGKRYSGSNTSDWIINLGQENRNAMEKRGGLVYLIPLTAFGTTAGLFVTKDCSLYSKALGGNIKKIEKLRETAISKRSNINLQWNKVISVKGYLDRLDSNMKNLAETLETMQLFEEDIITLLHPSIKQKIKENERKLEEKIAANNQTIIIDTKRLETTFYSFLHLGIFGLKSLAGAAGILLKEKISKIITEKYMKYHMNAWVSKKPGSFKGKFFAVTRNRVGPVIKVSYNNFVKRNLPIKTLGTSLRSKLFSKVANALRSGLKAFGILILYGLTAVGEIITTISHAKNCYKKETESYNLLANINGVVDKMKILEGNLTDTEVYLKTSYKNMVNDFQSEQLMSIVDDGLDLAEGFFGGNSEIKYIAQKLNIFKTEINKEVKTVDNEYMTKITSLTTGLVEAMVAINEELRCLKKRMFIIISATERCKRGTSTNQVLWLEARSQSLASKKNCLYTDMAISRVAFDIFIKESTKADQKSKICIRNSKLKRKLVCQNVHNNIPDDRNALVNQVTVDDIQFFKTKCPKLAANSYLNESICYLKSLEKGLHEILSQMKKFDADVVKSIYGNCALQSTQILLVCNQKNSGKSVRDVALLFPLYSVEMVSGVYSKCKITPSNADITFICLVSESLITIDPNHPAFRSKVTKYGKATVLNVMLEKCPDLKQ